MNGMSHIIFDNVSNGFPGWPELEGQVHQGNMMGAPIDNITIDFAKVNDGSRKYCQYIRFGNYWDNSTSARAQAQNIWDENCPSWFGIQQLGTTASDNGSGITSDSSGNIYVTGSTSGGLDGNTSAGNTDLFVVKYNSSGVKQWTQQLGTSTQDYD